MDGSIALNYETALVCRTDARKKPCRTDRSHGQVRPQPSTSNGLRTRVAAFSITCV